MADSESFVRCFSSFVARLDDRLPEVEQHFGGECSEEDMFSYFWGLQEAHKCLVLSVPETLKSESSAVTYRTRGNKLYRSKNLKEALKSFNFSIMFAPHPPVPSAAASLCEEPAADGTSSAFEALALAYANRSAVMFELNQYEECLKDVELAILHGYPEASRCKLLARKERCVAKRKEEGGAAERLLTTHKHCPAVATADPATPRKSDAIRLSHTPEKGRHFLANREILPGELLLTEESYSRCLLPEFLPSHCSVCLTRCLTPLPCPGCPYVTFCSSQCRSRGRRSHVAECRVMGALIPLPSPWRVALGILTRATLPRLKVWLKKLKEEEQEATAFLSRTDAKTKERGRGGDEGEGGKGKEEREARRGEGKKQTEAEEGEGNANRRRKREKAKRKKEKKEREKRLRDIENQNEASKHQDEEKEEALYRAAFHAVTNKSKHSPSQLLHACAAAFCLTKLLEAGGGFFLEDDTPYAPRQEEAELVGATLLRHLLGAKCNAFTIAEVNVPSSRAARPRPVTVGVGLSPSVALFNHSCSPSAFLTHCGGGAQALTAARTIPPGQEVTIDYLIGSRGRSAASRQSRFLSQYGFSCSCDACARDRPAYPKLPDYADVLSEDGLLLRPGTPSPSSAPSSPVCQRLCQAKDYNDLGIDLDHVPHKVKEAVSRYKDVLQRCQETATPSEDDVRTVCDLIHLLDVHAQKPSSLHLAAQLTLEDMTLRRFLHAEIKDEFYY